MEWYNIGALICTSFFVIQTFCQCVGFDFDLEISDEFSFKGLLHFLVGFFVTLCCFDEISIASIAAALIIGVMLMLSLGFLYRYGYKKLQEEIHYQQEIPKQLVEVYTWNKTSGGIVGLDNFETGV